jgi:hypothetical protein
LKKHPEKVDDSSESELDEDEYGFEESDDEDGFVFNPFDYNGIKYHLVDDGELYNFPPNEDGELIQFGTLHEDGSVTEM